MEELENDDLDLVGETTIPDEDDDSGNEEAVRDDAESTDVSVDDEGDTSDDEEDEPDEDENSEDEDEEEEEEKPKGRDSKTQALDAERARRKQAEKELKELKAKLDADKVQKEQEDILAKERAAYKQKMLEGDLIDEETADKLLDVFGNDVIKNKLDNERRTEHELFEEKFQELKKKDLYMDADVYKPQIETLMKKGLTAEQAYMASISESRFMQMRKDLQIEAEQKILNNQEKAERISVGVQESKSEVKGTTYSKEEQRIAKETGLPVKEVHKRMKINSIEDIEKL